MDRLLYNIGPQNVTVYIEGRPHTVARSEKIIDAIRAQEWEDVARIARPAHVIAAALQVFGDVRVNEGAVFYRGRPINNGSVRRILMLQGLGLPIESEARCLASLMRHDDTRVIESFEDFVERWDIPRVADGRIVLVKAVRADFLDMHSGTVDWSVGRTVKMDWADVDRDPSQTCSHGLHAAPLKGAQSYARGGSHLIELHVWPEHIAALPYDYKESGKVRLVQAYVAGVIPDDVAADYYGALYTQGDVAPADLGADDDEDREGASVGAASFEGDDEYIF